MTDIVERLRGRYAIGPHLPNGPPEFGVRQFQATSINLEAADEIERLRNALDGLGAVTGERLKIAREQEREACAAWHDEREARLREVYRENRGGIDRDKILERANWHRDCAAEIRNKKARQP